MCGICGVTGKTDRNLIEAMAKRMLHRGPDSEGVYLDEDVALGMRRLKIIDLNTGDQPIHNEDQSVWVIFNGEIYNFQELRADLVKRGHRFYTQTDTEVIVHLYEEYKDDCVNFLRGMFAFSIWDKKEKRLLLARDRIGIKPLYYSFKNSRLVFASEIKSILVNPAVDKQINLTSLDYYLTFLYIPAPGTIYESINKLLPGHTLVYQNGKMEIKRYWELDSEEGKFKNKNDPCLEIKELLSEAVKLEMVSDVPLGALLSGGLDSSCVVGLMSKLVSEPIKTFSIGFEKKYSSYNELEYAKEVARLFHCDHREFIIKPDIKKTVEQVMEFIDEPFADSSAILNFLICKEARKFVTVALSGIGGDEVFGGYARYLAALSVPAFQHLPVFLRGGLKNISGFIPESRKSRNLGGWVKRYLASAALSPEEKYLLWRSYFTDTFKEEIYSDNLKDSLNDKKPYIHFDYLSGWQDRQFADRVNFLDVLTYLPDDLLIMADRMSMANSLELRVPLCDYKLIEFTSSIPLSRKMQGFKLKGLFKEVLKDLLPEKILQKRKQGFSLPLGDWLKDDLAGWVREVLSEENIKRRGLFDSKAVVGLIEDHFKGREVNTHQIWALFIFELWMSRS